MTYAQRKLAEIASREKLGLLNRIEQPQCPKARLELIRAQGHQPFKGKSV